VLGSTLLNLTHTDEPVERLSVAREVAVGGEGILVGEVENGGEGLAHAYIVSSGERSQAETFTNLSGFGGG